MSRLLALGLILGLSTRLIAADAPKPTDEELRFFESKVRPVLIEQCARCHGPEKQKAGLRLDSRSAAINGGDSGPAIVPGKPDESLLVAAIQHSEDGPKMPPSKKLPSQAIADLTRWVAIGAPWTPGEPDTSAAPTKSKGPFQVTEKDRNHWAFRPIAKPDVPKVDDPSWSRSPIDAFVFDGLKKKGLAPNPPASKRDLIRRASYDLTGLPPTPAEVDAFLKDTSPAAYESLIDRLLASPHYGEKWGRHWLDLVRFAETNSYERDSVKPNAWRYRDYVIRSLNDDKPYDRFVVEQLAGDELPDASPDAVVGTGFYRLGIWDDEPADRELARYDGYDDIVATTGQVFLGLTIDCARCHDHKLDPIPQADYYRLVSFFRNVNHYRNGGPTDEAPIFATPEARAAHDRKVAEGSKRLGPIQAEIAAIEDEFRSKVGEGAARRPDLSDLRYRFYRDTWDRLPDFDAIKAETTGSLPKGLFDIKPRTREDGIGFVFEGSLLVPRDGDYTFEVDSDDGSRLVVAGKTAVEYDGAHPLGSPRKGTVSLTKGQVPIRLDYFQGGGGLGLSVHWSGPGLARKALSAPDRPTPDAKPIRPAELARRLQNDGARILGADRFHRYQDLRRQLREVEASLVPPEKALSVSEDGPTAPETFILLRGNPQTKGEKVEPGFLQVLGGTPATVPTPPPGARSTGRRLALARWIASADNPLTARVIANRVWQHHFGRGLVRSVSNFGLQGDRPTHPELLDWLASSLIADGWHLKPLHRRIMLSNAYRMSSEANPKALAADPVNDALWRFDMRRLSAEEIRDSILAVTGTLNPKMYGPGVYPEIPAEVMAGQSVPGAGWGKSPPDEQARRSVYVHVKRSLLLPILESFDAAETDRSSPNRFATTQPTQALAMINGSFLNAQAAALADRLKREAGDDRRRQVELALKLATSRTPTDAEIHRGLDLISGLIGQGASPDAALQSYCLVVLNLNEFLYLD